MEYITIKNKEHVNLGMVDDEIRKVCKEDGGTHEFLVQVQGNTEEIHQMQEDLWHGRGMGTTRIETLDQDLLMLTFRMVVGCVE